MLSSGTVAFESVNETGIHSPLSRCAHCSTKHRFCATVRYSRIDGIVRYAANLCPLSYSSVEGESTSMISIGLRRTSK